MLAVSPKATALVEKIVAESGDLATLLTVTTLLSQQVAGRVKKLDPDPVQSGISCLLLIAPALHKSEAREIEELLSLVVGDCGKCQGEKTCSCADHLKLFGTARALLDQLTSQKLADDIIKRALKA